MIRKTLFILSVLMAFAAKAAVSDPSWYKYPVYCDTISNVVETAEKVYYTSGGNLFSFRPSDSESFVYDNINVLSDKDIKQIYHNAAKKYLLVVYDNSNIDLIYDNGKVVNLPDIKNANLTNKAINSVAFGADRIVVATDFGIVIFSDERYEVIESGIYNATITAVCVIDGKLIIGGSGTDFMLLIAPIDGRHNSLDKFSTFIGFGVKRLYAVGDKYIAAREAYSNRLVFRRVDFDNSNWYDVNLGGTFNYDAEIYPCADGSAYTYTDDKLIWLRQDGTFDVCPIPEQLQGNTMAIFDASDKIWCGHPDGIARYDISASSPVVLYDKTLIHDYTTDKRVCYLRWTPDGKRLYMSNMEMSICHNFAKGESSTNYQTTNYIEGDKVVDVSLKEASGEHQRTTKFQKLFGNKRMYSYPLWVVEDPFDSDKYYAVSYYEGVYVVRRNPATGEYEEIGKFDENNSPFDNSWGPRVLWVDIDPENNLWVGHQQGCLISVLPASKLKQDPKSITMDDWKQASKIPTDYLERDFTGIFCKKSNMFFYSKSAYDAGFVAVDTKGTYSNLADDVAYKWIKVTDQDGNNVGFSYITSFLEDNRGCVWVGTSSGVFEITNPSQATDYNMTVRRIKVPRNDGTNYADYLLDSDFINWMALDPAGRKWIATENSGIFLVSETGDEILQHYDKDNSPLPTNSVCAIECDPVDNTVYVGTINGLYSFKSDASAGKSDYSEIYAYPNPVRPDYSGHVAITGLVANSIVKITDTAGNVVYQTRSEGGMATWDLCNSAGARVRSGVYYAYAVESNSGASTGAVTKILVID